jgi:hypothetical protein
MDSPSSEERAVVTFLQMPVVPPLARVRRIYIDKTATILMESEIEVHERLEVVEKKLNDESDPSKQAFIAQEAHEIFRSGLARCLECLIGVTLNSLGKLVKIAISHKEWAIDDTAEWARYRTMELVEERLSPGISCLPTVDRWYRWACDGDPIEMESAGFVEPWCAPVWCSRSFSILGWQNTRTRSHERHSPERTERLISGDRFLWRDRLKNELQRAADQEGIDIEVQTADSILLGSQRLRHGQANMHERKEAVKPTRQQRPKYEVFKASADYRTIRFRGNEYKLTSNQAEIVNARRYSA